ncbi:MAG: hypothetical protein H6703_14775 [Myxococcales bacterium]|nr:hypothetical protein [Myxococcales bacterium]
MIRFWYRAREHGSTFPVVLYAHDHAALPPRHFVSSAGRHGARHLRHRRRHYSAVRRTQRHRHRHRARRHRARGLDGDGVADPAPT